MITFYFRVIILKLEDLSVQYLTGGIAYEALGSLRPVLALA